MSKILVVDDELDLQDLIKQKFRKQIKANKYDFLFAVNGVDALSKLEEHTDVDIVLSDINMPEMDGLTLLGKLKESAPLIKTVMVSAYGDMENIRSAMNSGAFDFITKPINFQDLSITMEKTIEHVQHIRNTVQAIQQNSLLKMYVDESVINFMSGKEYESSLMSNETIEATVMFIDICGFTTISEHADPDKVINLLNSYFDIMAKAIVAHEGLIDKFIGDAIMAVFRGENQLNNAIDAAISVRESIEELPAFSDDFSFTPKVAIGINVGEMISGNIGSESLRRLDFTVIGDTVNVAQRLESAAKENQIIINEATYQKAREAYKCEEIGSIEMKNKSTPVKVYDILGK